MSHPPGFTLAVSRQDDACLAEGVESGVAKENSSGVHSKVMSHAEGGQDKEALNVNSQFSHSHVPKGGSFLEVLDDMVQQSIGYVMDGCIKDIGNIVGIQGADEETKMDRITHMDEDNVFTKDHVTISDNFVAIYGSWNSNKSRVLFVVVYAPQSIAFKRVLWEYISLLISRWDGETILMGDFNEVRSSDEQLGLVFNLSSARAFNSFILVSRLVDVKMEGYSFTRSHPSASKMSKLDRFLVSEVDGQWKTDPDVVKDAFKDHFANRFKHPQQRDTGDSSVLGFCSAVAQFFDTGQFPSGCNASFIALIPKVADAKVVNDFRPISLIGSLYKVVTKILANRLATVMSDLVSDTQSAFVSNRQILDGPFILNVILAWCKRKKKHALIFKVDFTKAYDSVRWDYLLDVLLAFGFGPN
nr:RNA-directed DNA polymerase, eukaryota [Tanacetum cinerariifolium]